MSVRWDSRLRGYVLGTGWLYNPASVRHDGSYAFVGVTRGSQSDDTDWKNIMPYDPASQRWLEEAGRGRLVFVPDNGKRLVKVRS
jgi:hypothetical protein